MTLKKTDLLILALGGLAWGLTKVAGHPDAYGITDPVIGEWLALLAGGITLAAGRLPELFKKREPVKHRVKAAG